MEKNELSGEYLAPDVKVVEMKSGGVLCQSGIDAPDYNREQW